MNEFQPELIHQIIFESRSDEMIHVRENKYSGLSEPVLQLLILYSATAIKAFTCRFNRKMSINYTINKLAIVIHHFIPYAFIVRYTYYENNVIWEKKDLS